MHLHVRTERVNSGNRKINQISWRRRIDIYIYYLNRTLKNNLAVNSMVEATKMRQMAQTGKLQTVRSLHG